MWKFNEMETDACQMSAAKHRNFSPRAEMLSKKSYLILQIDTLETKNY